MIPPSRVCAPLKLEGLLALLQSNAFAAVGMNIRPAARPTAANDFFSMIAPS
jgi:hypothetical protein